MRNYSKLPTVDAYHYCISILVLVLRFLVGDVFSPTTGSPVRRQPCYSRPRKQPHFSPRRSITVSSLVFQALKLCNRTRSHCCEPRRCHRHLTLASRCPPPCRTRRCLPPADNAVTYALATPQGALSYPKSDPDASYREDTVYCCQKSYGMATF